MGLPKIVKPNHNGAKNGGGFWGRRIVAKIGSKKARRKLDRKEISEQLKEEK